MNKKELFGTLLGTIIGGVSLTTFIINLFSEKEVKNISRENIEWSLCFLSAIGSFGGGILGFTISKEITECIKSRSERESYREFFESQRIETNSNQTTNESTPLLQEHIININNEENLLNTDVAVNNSPINIL